MTGNPEELVKILLSNKLIKASDVVDSGIQLQHDERDRFVLSTLLVDGKPLMMLKRTRYPDAIESLNQEIQAYNIINKHPQLNFITPALLFDGLELPEGLFVMQWKDTNTQIDLTSVNNMHLLGNALGKLSAYTQDIESESSYNEQPWVLSTLSAHPRWKPDQLDKVITRTDQVNTLREGLKLASQIWHPGALVHGDLKREHCLLVTDNTSGNICILDWELAGYGDPAWDVASIISDILFNTQYGSDAFTNQVDDMAQTGNIQTFLKTYAEWQSLDEDFMLRIAVFTAARLFQTALESAALFGLGDESGVDGLLFMAAQVLHDPQQFAESLSTEKNGITTRKNHRMKP